MLRTRDLDGDRLRPLWTLLEKPDVPFAARGSSIMVTGPAPRRMTFKGAEVIVLEPEVYAQLDASRRQLGAKMQQVGSLKRQLQAAVELLDLVGDQVEEMPACGRSEPGDGCCPKHALADLLAGRVAQSVRAGARSGRGSRKAGSTG